MNMKTRLGFHLVAGAGIVALIGCGSSGGGNASPQATTVAMPAITQQPQDQTKAAGQTATFTVAATGNGTLTYQWQKDGVDLPGATAATYTTPALTAAEAGAYRCRVANTLSGSTAALTSSAANLVVNVAPAIATQPVSSPSLTPGGSVSFTVAANGNGALSYQWQKNGTNIPVATNASAATATLTLTNLSASDAGTYTCVVTATLNGTTTTTTSAPAVLGVGQLPTLNTQPAALQTVLQGSAVSFSVDASPVGGGTLTYQWLRNGVALDAVANPSAATATLTLASAQVADAATYTCAVTNTVNALGGTAVTHGAVLAVNAAPAVSSPVASQSSAQGGTLTLSVTATPGGPGTLLYQWFKGSVKLADGTANGTTVSGATTATLVLTNVSVADAASYSCVVTNQLNGTVNATSSNAGVVSVTGMPVISVNPAPATLAQGSDATFTVAATGNGTLTYQWLKNGSPIDSTANPSAATDTLALASVAKADGASYSCRITNTTPDGTAASQTSNGAVLTVNYLAITQQPATTGWASGVAAVYSVTTDSAPGATLTYRWSKAGANLTDATPAVGTTVDGSGSTAPGKATLTLGQLDAAGADKVSTGTGYACVITSTLNGTTTTVTTNGTAYLVVPNAPVLTGLTFTAAVGAQAPSSSINVATKDVTVTYTLSGTPTLVGPGTLSYEWQNPTNVPLGTTATPTFTYTPQDGSTNGTAKLKVTTILGNASAPATYPSGSSPLVSVNSAAMSATAAYQNFVEGTSPSALAYLGSVGSSPNFNPTAATLACVWTKDGQPFTGTAQVAVGTGANNGKLIFTGLTLADAGAYTCTLTSSLANTPDRSSSKTITIGMIGAVTITSQPTGLTKNQGDNAQFTVVAAANDYPGFTKLITYQWKKNGVAMANGGSASGVTTPTLTLTNVQTADNASYTCDVTNTPAPANGTASTKNTVVTSSAATLSVNPVVAKPIVTMDGSVLSGATGLVASTQDQGPNVTYAWTVKDGTGATSDGGGAYLTSAATSRVISYRAPATGTVTASVTVTSTFPSSYTGSATAVVKAMAIPDVVAPSVVHPGDAWMNLYTTDQGSPNTYFWSIAGGSAAGSITGSPYAPSTTLSVDSASANGSFLTVSASAQNGSNNASNTARVNVKTGVWLTKDGGSTAVIGAYPASVTLPSGRILVAGGATFASSAVQNTSSAAQILDPATGRMVATGAMNVSRYQHTLTLLPDGKVLAVGGVNAATLPGKSTVNTYLKSAEIWDPTTGLWTLLPNLMVSEHFGHCAVLLATGANSGQVAIFGGKGGATGTTYPVAIEFFTPASETWTPGPNMVAGGRYQATLVTLKGTALKANQVFIAGGSNGTGTLSTTELFDPANPATNDVAGPAMTKTRALHTATLLNGTVLGSPIASLDGNVLLAGGSANGQTAEIYNAATNTTVAIGTTPLKGGLVPGAAAAYTTGRSGHTATLLGDGTVLLAGGTKNGGTGFAPEWSVELYTPTTATAGTFAYSTAPGNIVGNMGAVGGTANTLGVLPSSLLSGHNTHTAAAIPVSPAFPSGGAAILGGTSNGTTVNSVELYKAGASPTLSTVGIGTERIHHATVRLQDGRVMVIGGYGLLSANDANLTPTRNHQYLSSVRIFDPVTNSWSSTGALTVGRRMPAASVLPNGDVLVTGGTTSASTNSPEATAELWNHATGTWSAVGNMTYARTLHAMQVLPNGKVLVIGGQNNAAKFKQDSSTGAWTMDPAGTTSATIYYQVCELYDPVAQTFSVTGLTAEPKQFVEPVRLASGLTVVAGGETGTGGTLIPGIGMAAIATVTLAPSSAVEAYDSALGTWTTKRPLAASREHHNTVLLPNGQLALIGGATANSTYAGIATPGSATAQAVAGDATELYDFTLNAGAGGSVLRATGGIYSTAVFTGFGHKGGVAALLPNGKVLVAGGNEGSSGSGLAASSSAGMVCEIYDPATDTFTATDSLVAPRLRSIGGNNLGREFTATTLPNGDILVVGGETGGTVTQIYRQP